MGYGDAHREEDARSSQGAVNLGRHAGHCRVCNLLASSPCSDEMTVAWANQHGCATAHRVSGRLEFRNLSRAY